jgi:tagatose-1,6-bisphosphate aldolase non-catalytic subunit AgaZ/GatZ
MYTAAEFAALHDTYVIIRACARFVTRIGVYTTLAPNRFKDFWRD